MSMSDICLPSRRDHGFVYLDQESLLVRDSDLGVVGTMNWYDYTWDNDLLRLAAPDDWAERLATKRFTRGMHNDANYVRWPLDDRLVHGTSGDKLIADIDVILAQHRATRSW